MCGLCALSTDRPFASFLALLFLSSWRSGASCGSSSSGVGLSASCALNSDCNSPTFASLPGARAVQHRCGLPSGERCVATQAARARHVCQLAAESTCTTTCAGAGRFARPIRSADGVHLRCGFARRRFLRLGGAAGPATSLESADEPVLIADGYIAADGAVLDGAFSPTARRARRWTQTRKAARSRDASPGDAVSPSADGSTDSTVTDGPGSSPADGAFPPTGAP